ncbi:NAD(P)H-binding protein [Streptomyces otsuchiensis]|uniref:NAD(P)H-binding protein n=1 Tax=Streptomyces otsuchiensis TaxID=2681388 RepID=UPI0014769DED|nr:NmrA family NAD(P)-binding protein [Streptomyces otsuchiensis]
MTGATGTVGGATARRLAATGERVRVLVRDPDGAAANCLAATGAEIRQGDHGDPPSLRSAMRDVRSLLMVNPDPLRPAHDEALVAAARQSGVTHLVKLSVGGAGDPLARDAVTRAHRLGEELVRSSGLSWTLLRPRAFMSNALQWRRAIRRGEVVRVWPPDAPATPVDPRDVAAVAALVVSAPGHAGRTYVLTGSELLTARDQVRSLGDALGTVVSFAPLTRAQAARAWAERHPKAVVTALLERGDRQIARGTCRVGPAVHRLLGRESNTFSRWARDHAHLF